MTDAQRNWMAAHPEFGPIGPPRRVKFSEWGTLSADGVYTRLDNQKMAPIVVGDGSIGVAVVEK